MGKQLHLLVCNCILTRDTDADVDGEKDVSSLVAKMKIDSFNDELPAHIPVMSDNGPFDLLPGEVLFAILNYLSIDELSMLSRVSTLFYEHCYSPLLPLHQHLNLQPFWYRVSESSLEGFSKKCTKLQSLNLSWCGAHNDLLKSTLLNNLIQTDSLTRLHLACCPLEDSTFKRCMSLCGGLKELDISSTRNYLTAGALQTITRLTKLER